jgi:ribosome recycling factor
MIPEIEKAIIGANLGFNPSNNGDYVIINIPPLTEERRRDLVKQAKGEAEDARVGIRSARQEANHELKRLKDISEDIVKDAEADVQKLTDKYIARVEDVLTKKEAEIMQV